ncbi:hypothetical protein FRC08_003319 [Ceratobasidium sp. 394]|nr:hypothetical protein FRC08_003319 [Ceratobasidium sp. 394]
MRSTSFLAFFLFALLSVLQLTLAEPGVPSDNLVERGSELDIAPAGPDSSQQSFDGGLTSSKSKSENLVCPSGYGSCPNDPGACCPLGGRCCGNRKCCRSGFWCYSSFCCPVTQNGCDGKSCIKKGWNCCKGGYSCKPGYYCIKNLLGAIRCCPNGKLCLFKDGAPAEKADASA